MSDLMWYSRLLVWVGALVMVIEAVAGRSSGFTNVIAVLMLIVGLVGLVYGLAVEGFGTRLSDPSRSRQEVSPEG